MSAEQLKQQVAEACLDYIEDDTIVGVGTGSTVNFFIDALATIKHRIAGTVASSQASKAALEAHGIPVFDLNSVDEVPLYIDGADESTRHKQLIKGGGGALTQEKIIAEAAKKFICIIHQEKLVKVLGKFPLPIEVLPSARSLVARALVKLGGDPVYRDGFVTDNGNIILDVHNLTITDPPTLEAELNNLVGSVTNGLFARRPADVLLISSPTGIERVV